MPKTFTVEVTLTDAAMRMIDANTRANIEAPTAEDIDARQEAAVHSGIRRGVREFLVILARETIDGGAEGRSQRFVTTRKAP